MLEIARLVDYSCFGIFCLTLPLQILVIISILRRFNNFKLNKSFFLFFVVNTFIDIISGICLVLTIMLPAWGIAIDWYLIAGANLGKFFWTNYKKTVKNGKRLLSLRNPCVKAFFAVRPYSSCYRESYSIPLIFQVNFC